MSEHNRSTIIAWLRRRQDWPLVSIPGEQVKEIADLLEQKDKQEKPCYQKHTCR